MLKTLRSPYTSQMLLRMVVDFSLVHLSMLAALAGSVISYTAFGKMATAHEIAEYFSRYYWLFFWPLSFLFPGVFLANGFYTRSRAYTGRYKALVILRGVGLAVLLFLAVNYFVFRNDLVSRSVVIWFAILVTASVTSVRFLKDRFTRYFEIRSKDAPAVVPRRETVLVVGGAGYIGSILVRRLLETGRNVRILDNLVYGCEAIREILDHPNVELMVGDCRHIQSVVSAAKGVDSIVHLAAIVGDPACDQDHQTAQEINFAATRMLIEVAKGHGIGRLVFASSCSVYGASELIMDERSAPNPISVYAQTKVDSEKVLLRARSESFHPTVLRLATVFGLSYRPRFDLVVNLLTAKAFQDGVITIYNGQQWRPFIHVRDIAEGILTVLNAPLALVSGQIFNLGDSRMNFTLSGVADQIRKIFPDTRVENVDNSDRRNYRVSFVKIRNQLGYQCRWSLEDGILELKKAFEEGKIGDYADVSYNNQKYLLAAGSPTNQDEMDSRVMAAFGLADFQGNPQRDTPAIPA